jgi:hypothetical protein
MRVRNVIGLFLTGSAAAACSNAVIVPDEFVGLTAPVVLDERVVTAERNSDGWHGEIGFRFVNVTGRDISLLNCLGAYDYELQRSEAGRWVTVYRPVLPQCVTAPLEIRAGQERPDRVSIIAGEPEPIAGTYRLVIGGAVWNQSEDSSVEPVPLAQRVSAPFEIQVR